MYDMGVYPLNATRYVTGEEPVAVTAKDKVQPPAPKFIKKWMKP